MKKTAAPSLVEQSQKAMAEGRVRDALALAARATDAAASPSEHFEALLHRARAEYSSGDIDRALATYWDARHVTKRHRLGRIGEADLGIGMTMLDLGRAGEGLEAVRRASRQFRKMGQPFLRGCAETVLADEALRDGDLDLAERHLEVAADLLGTTNEPRILSGALTLTAEVMARQGRAGDARAALAKAERVARQVANPSIVSELRSRRRVVLDLLNGGDDE